MKVKALLDAMHVAERLKDATRHCDTSGGRRESVAEHSWRLALMAWLMRDEFPGADMNRVVQMCLVHDLGEAFTGDIPSFRKTASDEQREHAALRAWVTSLPEPQRTWLSMLYVEMDARQSLEARIFKALDGMEAVIQHNEADLSTWSENEYALNMTYCDDRVGFSDYLTELREAIRDDTRAKLAEAGVEPPEPPKPSETERKAPAKQSV